MAYDCCDHCPDEGTGRSQRDSWHGKIGHNAHIGPCPAGCNDDAVSRETAPE